MVNMLTAVIILLFLLWLIAYTPLLGGLNFSIIQFNGINITLWDIVILMVVAWIIGLLPRPFRQIASVLLVLWILSILGLFAAFPILSSLIVLAIIISSVYYLVGGGW